MIRFDQVVKKYDGGSVAVDNLSFEAQRGEITMLVGPSGCGKTTSLRMINRMIDPTSGQILLDDEPVDQIAPAQLRRGIGYVIQHAGLFPHRTVLDNVATVPRLAGWSKAKARTRAHEVLELVGLPGEYAARYPSQLSGGQQQRVGVARALAADPPIMLMDEPFSAVDPIVREQLQDEFLRIQRELGKTIVFVTHDIDEAIKLGDQVAVLEVGGRLAQLADPAYLLAHPINDFVSDFVGRDRGYRALAFQDAPDFPLQPEPTVEIGATATQVGLATKDPWLLVVSDGRPQGWVEPRNIKAAIEPAMLHRGGTIARNHGPLRAALDAALSSPSRRGVIVDDDGRLLGTVRAGEVLRAIDAAERPAIDPADIAPTADGP